VSTYKHTALPLPHTHTHARHTSLTCVRAPLQYLSAREKTLADAKANLLSMNQSLMQQEAELLACRPSTAGGVRCV
jgi:hypothetical protein